MTFVGGHKGIFKSCPRVPKLRTWLLRAWGRCLKVTLQTCAPENFSSCRWGYERTRQACADGERGPQLAWAEILVHTVSCLPHLSLHRCFEHILFNDGYRSTKCTKDLSGAGKHLWKRLLLQYLAVGPLNISLTESFRYFSSLTTINCISIVTLHSFQSFVLVVCFSES